jgi:hypothetical protein
MYKQVVAMGGKAEMGRKMRRADMRYERIANGDWRGLCSIMS